MRKVSLIFILNLLVGNSLLVAQKQVTHQSLYWLRYFNTVNFNAKWNWQNEFDTRHFFVNNRQQQFIVHSRVIYRPNSVWNVGAGLTGSWQKSQIPSVYPRPVTPEYRITEEASVNQPWGRNLSANYRIRVEQRFISNHAGHFDSDNSFLFRHRYRFQLTYIWKKPNLTFRGSEEVFVNTLNRKLYGKLDQNRSYVSVEKRFSPSFSFEAGFMHINQHVYKTNLYARKANLRLTLYHTLNVHRTEI